MVEGVPGYIPVGMRGVPGYIPVGMRGVHPGIYALPGM